MKTADKKRDFLKSIGFELNHESEPIEQMGATIIVEVWKKYDEYNTHTLNVRYDSKEGNRCSLYYGLESTEAEVFSERNLISEMKKRF